MAYRIKNYVYNDRLSVEENLLMDRLYKLKMSGMAEALEKQFLNPNMNLESFNDRITQLINSEWDLRQDKKFKRLLNKATLKYPMAELDESIYEPDRLLDTRTIELLAKCEWLDDIRNLLITGSSGAGKTYIANALCVAALHDLRSVKYIRASVLLQECEKAQVTEKMLDYMNQMESYDLLVIDDFGIMDLNLDRCRYLFDVIEIRDHRKPTMIVSQFPVAKWWELFNNNTIADAFLSRVTSGAYRLECNGRDMRKMN